MCLEEKWKRETERETEKKRQEDHFLWPFPMLSDLAVSLILYRWETSLHCILTTDERHQCEVSIAAKELKLFSCFVFLSTCLFSPVGRRFLWSELR